MKRRSRQTMIVALWIICRSFLRFSPTTLRGNSLTFPSNSHGVKPTTAITPASIQSQHVGESFPRISSRRDDLQGALCVATNSGY